MLLINAGIGDLHQGDGYNRIEGGGKRVSDASRIHSAEGRERLGAKCYAYPRFHFRDAAPLQDSTAEHKREYKTKPTRIIMQKNKDRIIEGGTARRPIAME
jgi:hypothetical protein